MKTPRTLPRKRRGLRKALAVTLTTSLLLSQQGFFVLEAFAQTVAAPKVVAPAAGGTGLAGAGLTGGVSGNLSLQPAAGLGASLSAPGLAAHFGPEIRTAPPFAGALYGGLAPVRNEAPYGGQAPVRNAGPASLSIPEQARSARGDGQTQAAPGVPGRTGLIGRIAGIGKKVFGTVPAVSFGGLFDGEAGRTGAVRGPAGVGTSGDSKRRIGLAGRKPRRAGPHGGYGTPGLAGTQSEIRGLKPAADPEEAEGATGAKRVKVLRRLLGDGASSGDATIEPFRFVTPNGDWLPARGAGLEGFFFSKLEHQAAWGVGHSNGQLDDYFRFVDAVLSAAPGTEGHRRELRTIRYLGMDPAAKSGMLDEFLKKVVTGYQSELRSIDPAAWGREANIYMILTRAYNREKAGPDGKALGFFDSFDDAEFGRIKRETRSNTLWILDMFEIGEVRRWGTGGGSPYSIKGYHVKKELGGDEAFKRFVDRAHKAGLKVVTDYIPNHTSIDSYMVRDRPEGFIHIVPPQPAPGEDLKEYRRRVLAEAPKFPGGDSMYELIRVSKYPERGRRVSKFILVHHPVQFGGFPIHWVDMLQIDYTRPEARAYRAAEAKSLFERFGIDGVRRDMSYFVLNEKFFKHWRGALSWERDNAGGWVREELDRLVRGLETRNGALGGKEYLEEMMDAVREVNPAAFHFDEAYEEFEALGRSGTHARYNKSGLYDSLAGRNPAAIRDSLRELSFRLWQRGGMSLVNFVGTHDGGEGNPVDKFGAHFWAAMAMALPFRATLLYNGVEQGVGQSRNLIGDLSKSRDRDKAIPFDIPVKIDWSQHDAGNKAFFQKTLAFASEFRDALQDGAVDVLEPYANTPIVAYTASIEEAQSPFMKGARKTILVAANFGNETAWGHFRMDRTPVLGSFGAFKPEKGRIYTLRDHARLDERGAPLTYEYSGERLLSEGLFIQLRPGDAHLFEVVEKDVPKPVNLFGPGASRAAANGVQAAGRAAAAAGRTGELRVFVTRHGVEPVALSLDELGPFLAERPELKAEVNKEGLVRVVSSQGNPGGTLTAEDASAVEDRLHSYGVTAKVYSENLPIDWERKARKARESSESAGSTKVKTAGAGFLRKYLIGPLTAPIREAAYILRTLKGSMTKPTVSEVVGGVLSKAPAFALAAIWWTKLFLPAHPAAWVAAMTLSLTLDVFHGIWINSWANLQNNVGRQRGVNYQTVFNFVYAQIWGVTYRTIAWLVIAGTVAPWSLIYWRDLGLATILGTFFGTLGYQGLNSLYNKGRVPRWGRSGVQQVRDLFFCLAGVLFGAGSMNLFWVLFAVQQSVDIAIFFIGMKAKKRPILYVAEPTVAAAEEFQGAYPVAPGPEVNPLKQALQGLLGIPFLKPLFWLAKKALGLIWKKKA